MKVLKWIGLILLAIIVCGVLFVAITNEKEPEGYGGSEADELGMKMMDALNKDAWDALPYVQFSFRGNHHYRWDKKNNIAEIVWGDKRVVMQLDSKEAKVFEEQAPVLDEHYRNSIINEAWKLWCNDSFWFYAPFKAFDAGTERSIVDVDGKQALKVTYKSGGTTPGDVYLWNLDSNYRPTSWKMWTSILPKKGFETTWEKWIELPGGAQVATLHSSAIITLELTMIKAGNSLGELNWDNETFNYN